MNAIVSGSHTIPNRTVLKLLVTAGWLLIVGGFCLLVYLVWHDFLSSASFYPGFKETSIRWYHWLTCLIAGIGLATYSWSKYKKYFVRVRSGKIVGLDTSGGYYYFPLSWDVCVEGKTLAGEARQYWASVPAGIWQTYKIGDRINL